ncbi:ATP-binding protein [Gloeocapsopsis sp. IPPAS B-1203]|uniref:hybrid sensor histidine kinase/response regulator n=1 Tax=Gloeocapsopsis sp. IPPAS B-1203 TaxID=2049454 RepID=UPI000C1A7385|nr:ATP-binding protein [Gloeocapsopsis sp. IPPAS B-1203]PIG93861.1 histidine kinase [Gloeocapsopsis sp. IPPAS B-1203]
MMPELGTSRSTETIFAGGSEMAALMRSHDWSNTSLGPVENWSPTLKTLVSTILASRFPQAIYWGEDYIQFYNDALIPIYGAYHPHALGQPLRETWTEVWDDQFSSMCEGVRNTGEAFFVKDQPQLVLRFSYLEEAYFTYCYSSARDETGKSRGIFATITETTQQVISQRRLTMLRELATAVSGAKTLQSACLAAADTLNPYDIPFALFYQVNFQGNLAELVAASGLTPDSAAAPPTIALSSNDSKWRLAEVFQSREPQLMTDVVDRVCALPGGPWAENPHSAFILPILSGNKEQVECLLVAGISPRLPFNSEYRSFLELVAQQVESSIATVRSYEEERKRAEALAELDRAKTAFFSNVSHEFRTPLTLMLGPAEDALADQDNPLPPPQQQRLEIMQRNGLRLLKLVNTLLDFSRIESDRLSAVYEPTDLATFTAELASVFRSAIEKAKLRLVVDCPPLTEPIYVDRQMWEKIVFNLLSNAFKFTFTGEITVRLAQVDHQVELAVKDTGIGIPAAEIPHLFERFHRVKGAQGRTFEGSGIGLSLVQELVKLHGGKVQVSSVEGEGSCFRVSIPTGYAHLPPEQIKATRTINATAISATPYVQEAEFWLPIEDASVEFSVLSSELEANSLTQNSKFKAQNSQTARVLLVDDNADMREYVQRLLSQRWQVDTAANGAIALAQIQQQPPDLILSDVMMPEKDGFQLLQTLRADPQTKSIPIILLSARAGEKATIEGLAAGADDYLIKPFSACELLARVEAQLQMSRLRQAQSTNRFKDQFLMTVTHELHAPLAAILAWARLLLAKPFDQNTMTRALTSIERNATIEAKLVQDLLDVSSILAGKLKLQPQPVSLVPLIKEVVTTLRQTAQVKQIQLVEKIPDTTQVTVLGDGDRLNQIITNLLSNAIKFTPSGEQVEISLSIIRAKRNHQSPITHYQLPITNYPLPITHYPLPITHYAQIQVKDTGIGISPNFLPYVFDCFCQAEVPSRHSPGGVGIGLAIARYLVELHHGTIEVASEGEGCGATFTVTLPLV